MEVRYLGFVRRGEQVAAKIAAISKKGVPVKGIAYDAWLNHVRL